MSKILLDKYSINNAIESLHNFKAIKHNGKLDIKNIKTKISVLYYYVYLFSIKKNRSKMNFIGTINKISRKRLDKFYEFNIQKLNLNDSVHNLNKFIFDNDILIPQPINKKKYEDIIVHLNNELHECKYMLENIDIDIKIKKI